ncbi:MAG: hypothetical protein KH381_07985 [Clostridium sp.]|mgnify:CR=1 FL=1|jgi:hypothetical protein|nr:hypothetical protein [Clostridium sp.]DAP10250.1 MAG TPA: hypothetical protein [Caudoviricetes sp.]DAQ01182.1 MAG TPA: hypothetical protein [Caudoviricetes sp.]
MFSDEVLEKIFMRKELQRLDLQTQSEVIHAIEDVLEEVEDNADESDNV